MLHNAHNASTLMSSQLFLSNLWLSVLYISFPSFSSNLDFLTAFSQHYGSLLSGLKDPAVTCMTSFPALNFPGGMWAKNSNRKFSGHSC